MREEGRLRQNFNGKTNVTGAVSVPAPNPELQPSLGRDSPAPGPLGRDAGTAPGDSGQGEGADTRPFRPRQSRVAGPKSTDWGRKIFAQREDGPSPTWGDLTPTPSHLSSSPAVGPSLLSLGALGSRSLRAQTRALRLGHKNRHFIFSSRSLSLAGKGLKAEGWEEEGAGGGSGGGRNEKGEGSGYCAACGGSIPTGGFPNIVFNFLKAARDPETASPGAEDPGAGRAGG